MINILIEGMTENKGGKETYIINLYKAFNKEIYKFYFVAYEKKIAYEEYLVNSGASIIHLPQRKEGFFKFRIAMKKLFLTYKFDVVWAHKTTLSSCEILEYAKRYKIPLRIIHSHSSNNMGGKLTYVLHCINKCFLKNWANEFFACSNVAAKWFFGKSSCQIMKNGIDIEKYRFNNNIRQQIRSKLAIEDCFVIGHIGRFGKEKNHKKLINIFKSVLDLEPKAKLILCGDGEERENIENQINLLNLRDNILLLGVVDNVNEILQAIDIVVMPSFFEGLPFALLEAQAAGLKCVVSDTVSKESDILGWNEFLPISKEDEIWAQCILNLDATYNRLVAADEIRKKGFHIGDCTRKIELLIDKSLSYR